MAWGMGVITVVAMVVLGLGALVGFTTFQRSLASFREAAILGGVAAIPAFLLSIVLFNGVGMIGAIAAGVLLSALVAALGGGGLRKWGLFG
jgi:hypothetical protein